MINSRMPFGRKSPLEALAMPGAIIAYKYSQYRQRRREAANRRVTERELSALHNKIVSSFSEFSFSICNKNNLGEDVPNNKCMPNANGGIMRVVVGELLLLNIPHWMPTMNCCWCVCGTNSAQSMSR